MRHTVSRFIAAWAAVATLCLLAATPAGATVTSSTLTVTSPQGSYLVDNQVYSNGEQITLGGTTNGVAGDKVDIKCFSDGGSLPPLATAVPVDQSGAYSFSGSFRAISRETCVLRAVPSGDATDYPPGSSSPYSGPLLNIGQQSESRVVGGANGGDLEYYYLYASQPAGAFEYASLGGCSISQSYAYDPTTFGNYLQFAGESLDFCNAWFSWANGGTKPGEAAPTRSELQVDGVDAFVAGNAWAINNLSTANNPGFPSLKYSYTIDPATGDVSLDETDQVVRCSPGGLFPPTAASCPTFVPTGVQVTMHIVQTQAGRVARVVQWFQSVDGAAHAVDLLENNDFYHRNLDGQLEFPWTGAGMQPYTTLGQVLPGPPGLGPGAFFAKGSASTADGSEASPQGQVTFSNPPSSETIVGATNSPQHFSWVDLHYSRTIPAGGSVPLGFSYSSGYSAAQAAADATAAEAVFRPTVTIVSPQSGIDTAQRTVTVAGAAADVTGLTGVTVNGQPAAVGAGGIWSAPVGLAPGLNTITVVATNVFGNTAQAQSAVVYVPPPAFYALHQAHRRWREGGRRGRHRPPVGTAFTWTLNEPAELRFVFTAQVPGRPGAGGACVAANRRNRHHRRCLRTITVGAHSLSAGGGAGRWRFGGVMAGGRRLGPGTYTVTIVATTPATGVQSAPARLRFTIVH